MTKKIGLFGGTFDPIHNGHLDAAVEAMERESLDEVWFFPTGLNPFKPDGTKADREARKLMTCIAISPFPQFICRTDELDRPGTSYAIDTLRELTRDYSHDFSIIVGSDAYLGVPKWKESEALMSLAGFIVIERGKLNISSTEIRERIRKGLPCSHLMPPDVERYIVQERIYL